MDTLWVLDVSVRPLVLPMSAMRALNMTCHTEIICDFTTAGESEYVLGQVCQLCFVKNEIELWLAIKLFLQAQQLVQQREQVSLKEAGGNLFQFSRLHHWNTQHWH